MRIKIHIMAIVVLLSFGRILYSIPGYYIEPKFSFYEYLNRYDIRRNNYKMAFGYGLALGYDFSRLESAIPIRLELEYLGNMALREDRTRTDYLLLSAYYDVHFYYIRREQLAYRITGEVYRSMPFLSVYFGASGGMGSLTRFTASPEISGNVLSTSSDFKMSYLWSVNGGFMIHLTRYIGLNFGYKWINTPIFRDGHEVLFGVRFTIPDISINFNEFLSRE